ncbi:uncharacterized protein A4U43_C01F29420 [Asparagus officinalis]|uniref:Uncharacterized protein n=1 Tax=Asparagus officinalis TaxID=4686 RepID=A0A5P1FT29_ASPOF|nr:uncharacterized protein A4U43_C01F29420 [Asparagus officinalis]
MMMRRKWIIGMMTLIELEDADDASDVGSSSYMPDDDPDFGLMGEVAPLSFSTGGHFEPVFDFEGAYGTLESMPIIDTSEPLALAPVLLV